ncbi:MAG TPA: hypothetical protein VE820_12440, partial [Sphingomicrobium sp.]|nr:hypothetical protein [Sphingomicrobium sp.]
RYRVKYLFAAVGDAGKRLVRLGRQLDFRSVRRTFFLLDPAGLRVQLVGNVPEHHSIGFGARVLGERAAIAGAVSEFLRV